MSPLCKIRTDSGCRQCSVFAPVAGRGRSDFSVRSRSTTGASAHASHPICGAVFVNSRPTAPEAVARFGKTRHKQWSSAPTELSASVASSARLSRKYEIKKDRIGVRPVHDPPLFRLSNLRRTPATIFHGFLYFYFRVFLTDGELPSIATTVRAASGARRHRSPVVRRTVGKFGKKLKSSVAAFSPVDINSKGHSPGAAGCPVPGPPGRRAGRWQNFLGTFVGTVDQSLDDWPDWIMANDMQSGDKLDLTQAVAAAAVESTAETVDGATRKLWRSGLGRWLDPGVSDQARQRRWRQARRPPCHGVLAGQRGLGPV